MNKWFDRIEYGTQLLNGPVLQFYSMADISAMAGVCLWEWKLMEPDTVNLIWEKIKSNYSIYEEDDLRKRILKTVLKVAEKEYSDIPPIEVTQSEIDTIKNINGSNKQKLLFTILCYVKYTNALLQVDSDWMISNITEVFQAAGVHISKFEQDKILFELKEAGLITHSMKITSNKFKIHYRNDHDETVFTVKDLRGLGAIWLDYIGGPYMKHRKLKLCRNCDAPFIDSSSKNNVLYCPACRKLASYQLNKRVEKS